jgi:hypothetical protein
MKFVFAALLAVVGVGSPQSEDHVHLYQVLVDASSNLNITEVNVGKTQDSFDTQLSTRAPCDVEPNSNILCIEGGTSETLKDGAYDKIFVEGTLRCPTSPEASVRLATSLLEVRDGGVLECGTLENPVQGRVEIYLTGELRSILVLSGGVLRMHGNVAKSFRNRLAQTANSGDSEIHLRSAVQGSWEVGDVVVVATTAFHKQLENQWKDPNIDRLGHNEVRSIAEIRDGQIVRLSAPLTYLHYGEPPETFTGSKLQLDEAAYVVNLNRSIYLKGPAGEGADLKALRGGSFYASAVEIANFGVAGEMGRYPFHWHKGGEVRGQYIKASSIHDSHQRCIVIHGTIGATVEGNTCFNFFGHGVFLEDGDEVDNVVAENTVILAKKPLEEKALLMSEIRDLNPGRFPAPSSYWIANPENNITGNVAIASEGSGFWNAFVRDLCCTPENACVQKTKDQCTDGQYVSPYKSPTVAFDNNIAASCVVGMNWDAPPAGELTKNPLNPHHDRVLVNVRYEPSSVPTFRGNIIYKSSNSQMYVRSKTAIFDSMVMADSGFGVKFAYNNILKDSLVVGWSANAEEEFFADATIRQDIRRYIHKPSFFNLYDGPFVFENVHVAGFPTESVFLDSNPDREITPAIFRAVGALDRTVNLAKQMTFEGGLKPRLLTGDFFQSSTLYYDEGGSRKTIVGDYPLNYDSSCQRYQLHGTSNLVCPEMEVGHLRFDVVSGADRPYRNARIVRSRDSNPSCHDCVEYNTLKEFPNAIRTFVQLIMNKGYRYHITIPDMRKAREAYTFKSDIEGTFSPVLYFDHSKHCNTAEVILVGRLKKFKKVYSEAELLNANTDVVHYMSGSKLALRVKTAFRSPDATPGYAGTPGAHYITFHLACTSAFSRYNRPKDEEVPDIKGIASPKPFLANGNIRVSGWACAVGTREPVEIDVQVNGTFIGSVAASDVSEKAIANICQDTSGHRFMKQMINPLYGKDDYEVKLIARYGRHQKVIRTYISLRTKQLFSEWLAKRRSTNL